MSTAATSPRDAAHDPWRDRWRGRTLHFIGVGGAGMSGYARVASRLGARVSGSDRADSPYLERLRSEGLLEARIGHAAENLPEGSEVEVIYSSAVPAENPERVEARRRGLPERPRSELLAELSGLRRTVAVAGTHGKTTTSSMLVRALRGAGMDPGWLIGAEPGDGLPNAEWGAGEWLVVEADESDRSLLALRVEIAVLTNVELDHADAFGSLAELEEVFRSFLAGAPRAVLWDRPELLALRQGPHEAYDVSDPVLQAGATRFHWRGHEVQLAVAGLHNALDATAALEAARLTGAEEEAAIAALAGFHGAGRRFQPLGRSSTGARIYDDYAHHPTEVRATLEAARLEVSGGGRLVAVFQPHLYSRTRMFAHQLGRALALADLTVVLDVYPAREDAARFPDVSGLMVAAAAAVAGGGRPVYWLPTFAAAEAELRTLLGAEDLCVVMGAGNVDTLARSLVADGAERGPGR